MLVEADPLELKGDQWNSCWVKPFRIVLPHKWLGPITSTNAF